MSTFIQYTADGSNNLFNVPFPYISRTHVKVLVSGYVQVADGHYDWLNDSTISFRPSYIPKAGAIVEIRRETPLDTQIVTFQSGAVLTEEELNLAVKQTLYLCQELRDKYDARLEAGLSRLSNGEAATIDEMIAAITQEVLSSQLLADLQTRITDIDLNAEAILEQHSRLNEQHSRLDALQATVDSLANIDGTGLATFLENLQQQVIDGDTALAETIALIGAESADGLSFIINTNTAKISPTETLGQRLSSLQSAIDTNEDNIANVQADLVTEQTTRATQDAALSSQITSLSTTVTNNYNSLSSAISAEQSARTSAIDALASDLTTLTARVNTNEDNISDVQADLLTEQTVRANADTALSNSLMQLTARVDTNEDAIADVQADLVTEQTTRADADEALSNSLMQLTARVDTNEDALADLQADILTEQTVRANADEALSNNFVQLEARVDTNEDAIADVQADILAEQTARASGDTALAETIALLGAKNPQGTAFILNTATTMVDASTSLGARLSGIEAQANRVRTFRQAAAPSNPQTGDIWIDTDSSPANQAYRWSGAAWQSIDNADIAANKAAILNEQTARANADSALAADISTLQARVTTAEGDIQSASVQISAQASAITGLESTVTQLAAQYMVKLDVNGYVSGFGLYNEGSSSQFIVLADKFAVVTPGASPVVPFAISDGVVYMQNVVIQDALINSLTVSKLSHGVLNADMNVGTGKIIWDNGAYMKVAGVGFGTANQFIEWFGPKMPISSCSEDNAVYYLKTNGQAYFGGSLSAGTLFNSISTTNLASNAEVTLGPYGSNGGSINVVCSYTLQIQGDYPGNTVGQSHPMNATIYLYRSINGGAEQHVATVNASGFDYHESYDPFSNTTRVEGSINGATTYIDNAGAGTRTYRAAIVSRTISHLVWKQQITITSTEE